MARNEGRPSGGRSRSAGEGRTSAPRGAAPRGASGRGATGRDGSGRGTASSRGSSQGETRGGGFAPRGGGGAPRGARPPGRGRDVSRDEPRSLGDRPRGRGAPSRASAPPERGTGRSDGGRRDFGSNVGRDDRPSGPRGGIGGGPTRGRGSFGRPAPRRDATPVPVSGRGLGGEQVEGRQAVRELLLAGRRRVRDVWMAEGTEDAPILLEIEALCEEARVPIRRVSRDQIFGEARTETPQGVLAHAAPLDDVDVDELFERPIGGRRPFVLAVDSITDPQNLGALIRSADGAGVTGLLLPKHRNVHVTASVTKAAAGAVERMPMALVGGLPSALLQLKERYDAWIIGLDADGTQSIYEFAHLADEPLIVVVGAEGAGLSQLVAKRCDVIASIPLRGALPSLNASAAGAVALFEFGRHRK